MSPQTIAHYRITAKLGQGGMGEVYRATDTKLNRDVAIKILPDAFAQDADRMARFTREAQVLASLNHPNIAAIYGVEERALVMELAEGLTLAERIAAGAIPLEEALPIARQIAEALEYAHDRGIIHRDLKPANIKITPEGRVKVLDFGLAKAMSSDATHTDPRSSPTLTMRATMAGVILGTAGYMSPEQARGGTVDKRADIWAYGVVMYEMLTGRMLFAGSTVSDTLAAVLTREPDWESVPAKVWRLLQRCLEKDPKKRLRDIGDSALLLEDAPVAAMPRRRSRLAWAAAAALAVALGIACVSLWRASRPVERPLVRLNVDLGPNAITGASTTVAISPDGRRLVFPARGTDGRPQLAIRLLDQEQATLLPGTLDAHDPFFSPDGRWVGFFADSHLKKISVQGGAPLTLCNAPLPRGASWGDDGNIVAAMNSLNPLSRVPEAGGRTQPLTKLAGGEVTHRWPQVLPGSRAVLFTASPSSIGLDNANIEAIVLKTGATKILQRGGYYGRYLPTGHLVYVHQGVLFGVAFDPDTLETRGAPVPLLEGIAGDAGLGGGQFDFSQTGTLVYLPGKGTTASWPIAWLDSSGKTQPVVSTPGPYYFPRVSPDGRRLAFSISAAGMDVFVYNLDRQAMARLTFSGRANLAVWSPDGKYVIYRSTDPGEFGFWWVRSDGAGEPQRLLTNQNNIVPWSFSPDGRRLAYLEVSPDTGYDLWTMPLDTRDPDHPKPGKPEPFLRTPADERVPEFSPDGHWIAYRSNESGTDEVYVRPFPGPGGKWQISSAGGSYMFWSKNGRELFYEASDRRIMAVEYTADGNSFVYGKPRVWSDRQIFDPGVAHMDLAPDGKRFAVLAPPDDTGSEKGSVHVTFLENFFDELRRRLPGK